jgi:predicted nucleic acid-binding protein
VHPLVIDTNVYIDWINARRHEATLFRRDGVKYLSAVVVMELTAGALAPRDRRLVRGIVSTFRRNDRVLVPSSAVFEDTGHVLRALHSSGYAIQGRQSLVNDVLIALSARSIGATLVTQNARDFQAIQAIRAFRLEVISGADVTTR